jgi:hypothetical protein
LKIVGISQKYYFNFTTNIPFTHNNETKKVRSIDLNKNSEGQTENKIIFLRGDSFIHKLCAGLADFCRSFLHYLCPRVKNACPSIKNYSINIMWILLLFY